MALPPSARAALRTAARLGLLVLALNAILDLLVYIASWFVTGGWDTATPWETLVSPLFLGSHVVSPAVAAVAFWASASDTTTRRRVAGWCAIGLLLERLGLLAYVAWSNQHDAATLGGAWSVPDAWSSVLETLWPVAVAGYLLLSYLGPELNMSEALSRRSEWTRRIVLPVGGLSVLLYLAVILLPAAQTGQMLLLLATGVIYGLMRRRHPAAGAPGWGLVTVLLYGAAVPAYVYELATRTINADILVVSWSTPISLGVSIGLVAAIIGLLWRGCAPTALRGEKH